MKKIDWKILILTCVVCLLPMVFGIALYDKLPEQMPVHFNFNNEVDRYASKNFALFGLSGIMIALQIYCCVISDINEDKEGKKPKMITIVKWVIPVITVLVSIITIEVSLGSKIDVRKSIMLVLGIIYIVTGNYMPKMSYEQMRGKMHPMPKNEKSYHKMIRMMGYTFVLFGFAILISIFFKPIVSAVIIITMIIVLIFETILVNCKKDDTEN